MARQQTVIILENKREIAFVCDEESFALLLKDWESPDGNLLVLRSETQLLGAFKKRSIQGIVLIK